MSTFDEIPKRISVTFKPDGEGYLGRECPRSECERYFKITPGTGLTGSDLPCFCPYCGHKDSHDVFHTKDQIEYAQSYAVREIDEAFFQSLKRLECDLGLISLKVTRRSPRAVHFYTEEQLETRLVCGECTLSYAVYGIFAFCPDCGVHNSLQMLEKNVALVERLLTLAATADDELRGQLLEDALVNLVSAFDGFGRETSRIKAPASADPTRAAAASFQNLEKARKRMRECFGIELSDGLDPAEWKSCCKYFQKRHLLAHKMGVVDDSYMRETADPDTSIGRRIQVTAPEIVELAQCVRKLGAHLVGKLPQ